MDLRNQSSHMHYIHVIKKGTVVQLMNQSPFGVPARKFRDINDIYDDEDSLRDISLAGRKLGSGASKADCNNRMRMLICSARASLWKDSFSDEAASESTSYDSILDESTLQQILKKSKMNRKKRKTPESGFGKEMSTTLEKHSVSQADDDLSDLILPLSCLVPNIRNKRRVKVVKDPNLSYPSQNAQVDFDKFEEAPLDEYHHQEMESTTQHSSLTSTDLQPIFPHNEDDNSDCSFDSLNSIHMNPTTVDILGEPGNSSQGSNMIMEENAGSLVQNQESLYDCLTTYSPRVLTVHKRTENEEYPEVAFQSMRLGYVYDLPVSTLSLQEDDSATPYSDVSMNAISPPMDLAPEELDRSKTQPFTNEICSQAGNDPVTFPCTIKASVKAEVSAMPGLVCESIQQLSRSLPIVLDEDVRGCIHMTPLPDACLHAPSHSVDHISGERANSEPCCIESELNSLAVENPVTDEPCCFESELDSRAAENLISDKHGNSEPCCTESETDSVVVENLVESDILSVRFTINEENEYLPSSEEICQSLRADLFHLHLLKVNVKDGISTESLLDLPSVAFTSPGYHTSDNNDLMDMHKDGINLAGLLNPVNQDIDDRFVASPKYEVDIEGERLHMVKEIIEDTKASSPRDKLIINSAEGICKLASSTLRYSDSGIPTTHTAQYDELPLATSCCITETSNSMATGSCGSLDKPFPPEMLFSERKDSPPSVQNELWRAMENIDTIDSREKLRSLGKLVSDNQIKKKKQIAVKGNEIKGYGQVNKSAMSKQSETKRSCSALELKHSGIKMARLLSSPGRDKKRGQCIPSGPEGAILFSKKQMQDFEALAYKLTRELASMKEIIEERLSLEAGTPDHVNDQVTKAINKASKTEQTARKRLSAMNRDCIRFCKIMKISEANNKDAANSETTAQTKQIKKIKFADEAGGELCQIKFIESGEVNTPTAV